MTKNAAQSPRRDHSWESSWEALRRLDRQLQLLAIVLIVVLGVGMLTFMYPAVFWFEGNMGLRAPEPAFYGLCVLLALALTYLLRKQANVSKLWAERLAHTALHDTLTDLPNRALFLDRLGQAVARSKRQNRQFAVLFIDLDDFKIVNDTLGHGTGDKLLAEVGRRLRENLRSTDTVARLGGDEFAMLLDDVKDVQSLSSTVERIRAKFREPMVLAGREIFIKASIGVAPSSRGYDRVEDILSDADAAMYRAKAQGSGGYETFDTSMRLTDGGCLRGNQIETLQGISSAEPIQRQYRRYITDGSVSLKGLPSDSPSALVSLGRGGVLIRSETVSPPVGESLAFRFRVKGYDHDVEACGVVVGSKSDLFAIRFSQEPAEIGPMLGFMEQSHCPWTGAT